MNKPVFVPLTFHSLFKSAPVCAECDTEEADTFQQYEIEDASCPNIWYKVLFKNDSNLTKEQAKKSLIGEFGHIERINVWSHLAAAALYLSYFAIRPFTQVGSVQNLSGLLSAVSICSFSFTFFLSSTYHVYSANRFYSALTRLGDYFGIYLSIAFGSLCDLSVTSRHLKNVKWQSMIDTWIAACLLVTFFVVRRTQIPIEETRKPYLKDRCHLGLARSTNVDLEHSSLRAAAGIAMAFEWITFIMPAFETLESECAWVFAVSRCFGTLLLLSGMFLDNVLLYPDVWLRKRGEPHRPCVCRSREHGCLVTSHSIWHIIAAASTIVTTFGTEFVILNSERLKE